MIGKALIYVVVGIVGIVIGYIADKCDELFEKHFDI